jgi:hypothetical protein
MPLPGHAYALVSSDTIIDKDGARSTEITPSLLFAAGRNLAVEPHFHVAKSSEQSWRYDATALGLRYATGFLPGTEWRTAVSLEAEKPKDSEENSSGELRLIGARTYPAALVAVNLIAGKEFAPHTDRSYGIGVGALTPLKNGDRAGLEVVASLPFADGVEILPGYYLSRGPYSAKLGIGLFTNRNVTTSTLHASVIARF